MEEKVISNRVLVWTKPIDAPNTKEIIITPSNTPWLSTPKPHIIASGLTFCNVNKINKTPHPTPSATLKIHLWKGAAPNLILNPTRTKISPKKANPPKKHTPPRKTKIDANVWVKKYLIDPSLLNLDFCISIRGKNAIVFNSRPTHETKREGEETTKKILIKILINIRTTEGESNTREEVEPISGAWTQELWLSLPILRVNVRA